jgi:ABC-type sulfate/molybdate transport systems ATPase subunit
LLDAPFGALDAKVRLELRNWTGHPMRAEGLVLIGRERERMDA